MSYLKFLDVTLEDASIPRWLEDKVKYLAKGMTAYSYVLEDYEQQNSAARILDDHDWIVEEWPFLSDAGPAHLFLLGWEAAQTCLRTAMGLSDIRACLSLDDLKNMIGEAHGGFKPYALTHATKPFQFFYGEEHMVHQEIEAMGGLSPGLCIIERFQRFSCPIRYSYVDSDSEWKNSFIENSELKGPSTTPEVIFDVVRKIWREERGFVCNNNAAIL